MPKMSKALARDLMMNVLAVYADKRSYDGAGRLGYGGQLNVLQDGGGTERHWWGQVSTYTYARVALDLINGKKLNPYDRAEILADRTNGRVDPMMRILFEEYLND